MELAPIMARRVVITGLGVVCPLATDLKTYWDGLIHGRSDAVICV